MPSPTTDADNFADGVLFNTMDAGRPPRSCTRYHVRDTGNASPRLMRSTVYAMPAKPALHEAFRVPLGLLISPLAELGLSEVPVPLVPTESYGGPVRCARCGAYINPHVVFSDGGRAYACSLCAHLNDVRAEYFAPLEPGGLRSDLHERPELLYGAVDLTAPAEYCVRPPRPPLFLLLIEATPAAAADFCLAREALAGLLAAIGDPDDGASLHGGAVRVGVMTYSATVQCYNLGAYAGAGVQMHTMADLAAPFLPLAPAAIFADVRTARAQFEALAAALPGVLQRNLAAGGETVGCALGAALETARLAMAEQGGRIFLFQCTIASGPGPGALDKRETDDLSEKAVRSLMTPMGTYYESLADSLVQSGISVEQFVVPQTYVDLATVGLLSSRTGGGVSFYAMYEAHFDAAVMRRDVVRALRRPFGFEGIMRVRTSVGLTTSGYYGHFKLQNAHDLVLAGVDADKSLAVTLGFEGAGLAGGRRAVVQAAMLYTSASGRRLLRVLTLSLPLAGEPGELFEAADVEALMALTARAAMREALVNSFGSVRQQLSTRVIEILHMYRKHCAKDAPAGQLILPEALKLLPVYTLCLLKCAALSRSAVRVDLRSSVVLGIASAPLADLMLLIYPRLYCVAPMTPADAGLINEAGDVVLPQPVRLSASKLADDGVYVLETFRRLWIWVGLGVPGPVLSELFGVDSATALASTTMTEVPVLRNAASARLHAVLDALRSRHRHCAPQFRIVKQQDALERRLHRMLFEDEGEEKMTYVEYLRLVHVEIQKRMQ